MVPASPLLFTDVFCTTHSAGCANWTYRNTTVTSALRYNTMQYRLHYQKRVGHLLSNISSTEFRHHYIHTPKLCTVRLGRHEILNGVEYSNMRKNGWCSLTVGESWRCEEDGWQTISSQLDVDIFQRIRHCGSWRNRPCDVHWKQRATRPGHMHTYCS